MPGVSSSPGNILHAWQVNLPQRAVSALFMRGLYLVTFLNFLHLLPIADMVWGEDYFIILRDQYEGGPGHFAMLLNHPEWRVHYEWFLYPAMALSLLGIAGITNMLFRILLWFLFVNLHFGNPEISNGGWHMLHHLLLLSVFLIDVNPAWDSKRASAGRLLHNLAFYGIWVQIVFVYLVAGVHKLLGEHWLSGEALAYVFSLPELSRPFVFQMVEGNNLLLRMGTWAALSYQLLFPVFIWVKRARSPLLVAGLGFHLCIVLIVGVVDFGLIMMAAYLIFLAPQKANRIYHWVERMRFRKKSAGIRSMAGRGD